MQKQLLNYVMLSNIAVRDDSYQQKVTEKDQNWKELSEEKNIFWYLTIRQSQLVTAPYPSAPVEYAPDINLLKFSRRSQIMRPRQINV